MPGRLIRAVATVALLAMIAAWVGVEELTAVLGTADFTWLVIMGVLFLAGLSVGASKVMLLTLALFPQAPRAFVIRSYLRSFALGMLAPSKLGELTFPHYLSKQGGTYGLGLAVLLVDKAQMFTMSAAAGSLGLFAFSRPGEGAVGLVITVLLVALGTVGLRNARLRRWVDSRFLGAWEKALRGFSVSCNSLLRDHPSTFRVTLALTILRMSVQAAAVCAGFRAFETTADFLPVLAIAALVQVISWLPITIAGLGLIHGSAVLLFSTFMGVDKAVVFGVFLLLSALGYTAALLTLAFLGYRAESGPSPEQAA